MTRQNSTLEFNTFIKGLVTEAGPLTFPQNASISEDNWVLLKDGSRRRRLGMNFEEGYQEIQTSQTLLPSADMAFNTFLWENAGGDASLKILVVQVGTELTFLGRESLPNTGEVLHQEEIPGADSDRVFSFSSVDGRLVVATGEKSITIFSINAIGDIVRSTARIKIRDLFGVEDVDPLGRDMLSGEYINLRPTHYSKHHIYNLRNQTWGPARPRATVLDILQDPIQSFYSAGVTSATDDGMVVKGSVQIVSGEAIVASEDDVYQGTFSKSGPITLNGVVMDVLDLNKSSFGNAPSALDYRGDDFADIIRPEDNFLIWNGEAWRTFDDELASEGWYTGETRNYPSNADSVIPFLFPNPSPPEDGSPYLDRFHNKEAVRTMPGSSRAPTGYFIIDALDRGTSRNEQIANLHDRFDHYDRHFGGGQFVDETPGGPTTIDSYAGRVWYAGFPGEVIGGDKESPSLGSYVMFSQLVKGKSDITSCYQAGDPTSKDEPDLVDTDGGFINISGAYGIKKIISLGRALIVLASNGVWSIQGGSDYGFTATNYLVDKVSDHAIEGAESVVVVDGTLFFWGMDGIYHVAPDQSGYYKSENISKNTIQSFYDSIPAEEKLRSKGFYDGYDNKIRWLYGDDILEGAESHELVFDTSLVAFYPATINRVSGGLPVPVSIAEVKPYTIESHTNATRESMYLTITGTNPITFTMSTYNDPLFMDWSSYDGVGIDSPAHLITGYVSGGDFQRYKQVPYLTMHFNRTEDGFIEDEFGDLWPAHPSSCLVQARWEWTNSPNSNRWGREFQAYRYRRHYLPENAADPYDTGFATVISKNRLRGKGRVLSLHMRTEPGKDCHIYGWSMLIGVNSNV